MNLPDTNELLLQQSAGVLSITLNNPKARNAMSLGMVKEIMTVFEAIRENREFRVVVIRGAEGNFCAGGNIKDMSRAKALGKTSDKDPIFDLNRAFGHMITLVNAAPQVVITLLEGAVLGGGFGLACIADIAIADKNCQFGIPETSLGIPPAQIAPFVVKRIGLTQARRLVLTGARFNGEEALKLGVVHFATASSEEMEELMQAQISQVKRCAPNANAVTKEIILNVGIIEHEALLDDAARKFASALQGGEGPEGTLAFVEKRLPAWAQ